MSSFFCLSEPASNILQHICNYSQRLWGNESIFNIRAKCREARCLPSYKHAKIYIQSVTEQIKC